MVSALSQTLEASDETAVKYGFEVLESLTLAVSKTQKRRFDLAKNCLRQETPLLNPHLTSLIQFLLSAAGNQAYEGDLRIMVLNALLWIVKLSVLLGALVGSDPDQTLLHLGTQ